MKKFNFMLLTSLLCISNVFAAHDCRSISPEDIQVALPFQNQSAANGPYSDGICFPYNLNQSAPKKIVCELSQFESGWLVFFTNGVLRTSDAEDMLKQDFKGTATVILTTKGETKIIDKNVFQIRIDDNDAVGIHHDMLSEDSTVHPQASCRYEDEK